MTFRVNQIRNHAIVEFDYDADIVRLFKSEFKRAKFDSYNKLWLVPGKTAAQRVNVWLPTLEAELKKIEEEEDQVLARSFIEDKILESKICKLTECGWEIDATSNTSHEYRIRRIIKSIYGYKYKNKEDSNKQIIWIIPFRSTEDLRKKLPLLERLCSAKYLDEIPEESWEDDNVPIL